MPDFSEALMTGKKVEQMFLNRLKMKYKNSMIIEGSFKPFDIYSADNHTRYEIKCDMKSKYTNNFLIEVQHYGKSSALMTTEAEYWVFYDSINWIVVRPEKIKDLILSKGYKQVKTIGNGDTHAKLCYLVKKQDIQNIASQIEPCSEFEIIKSNESEEL